VLAVVPVPAAGDDPQLLDPLLPDDADAAGVVVDVVVDAVVLLPFIFL
jgi:hypothetical protein